MKEKLQSALGSAGIVLFYIIGFLYAFAPLLVLDFPLLVDILLILAMNVLPLLGELVRIVLYVWAVFVVLSHPLSGFSIFFLVIAAVYFFTTVWPILTALFGDRE